MSKQAILPTDMQFEHNGQTIIVGFRYYELDEALDALIGHKVSDTEFERKATWAVGTDAFQSKYDAGNYRAVIDDHYLRGVNEKIIEHYGAFGQLTMAEVIGAYMKSNYIVGAGGLVHK